jgi:hypothetical protein
MSLVGVPSRIFIQRPVAEHKAHHQVIDGEKCELRR